MSTWTQQTGFPLVTIIRDGETVTATQKRFLLSPREKGTKQPKSPFNYKWYIPLNCYTHEPPGNIDVWMNMTNGNTRIIILKFLFAPISYTKYLSHTFFCAL